MRKSLWIMLAVLVVAIGAAPNARADTFTYSYTDPIGESWSTKPITGVTGPTTVLAADLTATSNTGEFAGCTTTSVVLDFAGIGGTGSQRTNFSGCQFTANTNTDNFALSDFAKGGMGLTCRCPTLWLLRVGSSDPKPYSRNNLFPPRSVHLSGIAGRVKTAQGGIGKIDRPLRQTKPG
jgi:hypothetical protein